MKQKMDIRTKAKLIYSIELGVFAAIFIVLAILKFVGVIGTNATRLTFFNWITIFGGSWIVADFLWAMLDKKRQKRVAIIDKCLHLPAGLYLISFDLYCLITKPAIDSPICRFGVPIVLAYLGLCYAFEAIYHFKYPVPGLLDGIEKQEEAASNEQDTTAITEGESDNPNKEDENHD